jgi:chemotaxis signal transduction protein
LGIPAEHTEKIISIERAQTAVFETENGEVFISLPALFQLKESAPNGIILKAPEPKTILLTPKIDIDLEIPEENIRGLPESFSGWARYFRGACFNDQNVILILDPGKIKEIR